jgi:putative peptidoglycan lipid II flippase
MAKNLGLLLRAGLPALAATGAAQLILLSATNAASFMPAAVSWLYYAERVFQLPLGFVSSAVGLVLLPEIALRQVGGDRGGVLDLQNRALEAALLLALPAATALATMAEPMARVLFERGAFGPSDTAGTAMILAGLAPGLVFAAAGKVLAQPFFIRGRLRTPLLATALGVLVTAACAWAAAERFGALGLGLAASLGLGAHAAMLALRSHGADLWRPDARLLARVWRIAAASAAMGATTFAAGRALADRSGPASLADAVLLAGFCVGGLALYLAAALALGALTSADLSTLRRGRAPLASAGRASP